MAITTTYSTQTLVSEFQVNTWTSNNQLLPDSVGLNNGGWVTAYNNDGGFVLLNFYDADGVAVGGFDIPYSGGTSGAGQPSITKLANGNILVIWDENEAGNEGLSGRIFTQDGVAVGNELKFTGNSVSFEDPDVAALPDGGYIISFTFGGNVFYGRYTASGSQVGGFTQVNTATTGIQNDSSVTVLTDGGWVVSYTDTDPANQLMHLVVYNADGTIRHVDSTFDSFGDNTQSVVQALPNGRFAVVYTDSGWAEGGTLGNGITLQLFNADGTTFTSWIRVNTPAANDEREPDITVLDNGFIVVSWTRPFAGADDDIYGAIYDQNGNVVMSQFSIAGSSDTDIRSAVAGLLNGEFVTTWQDSQTDGSGGRISGTVRALVRTTTGDGANDTINVDSLRDIVNAGDGDDTIMGGGILAFENDAINGGNGHDRILATDNIVLTNATLTSIDEIEWNAAGAGKNITVRADQIGAGLASNLTLDFAAIGTPDLFRVLMGSATSLDMSGFTVQDFDAAGSEHDRIVVQGDADAETMRGTSVRDELLGREGNDVLEGGGGGDLLAGGAGFDRASYEHAASGVIVNMTSPGVNTGDAAGDSFNSIEAITGSAFDDTITGNAAGNSLAGGAGNDGLSGMAGNDSLYGNDGNDILRGGLGADVLSGGAGIDTATYSSATAAVRADLLNSAVNTGEAAGDTYVSIENLTGSTFNDILAGNNAANTILGLNGNDNINGRGGVDVIDAGVGNDRINGGLGNDTLTGGAGNDRFVFDTALANNKDTITDFNFVNDTIELDNDIFTAIVGTGVLTAAQFGANATGTATTAAMRIIYNTATGDLFYDSNGNAAGGRVAFAHLDPGLGITRADFFVV